MAKTCSVCGGAHYAKNKCKIHYKMPSQLNPKSIKHKVGDVFIAPKDLDWQGFPKQYRITSITNSKPNKRVGGAKKRNEDKSTSELKKLAQIVVNKYIRQKYSCTDGTTRCFTCLRWVSTKEIDASHFISVKHQSTRFHLDNLRSCCQDCNRFQYGNLKVFRQHLVEEIGESAVEELELLSKQAKHWSKEELIEIIDKYKI